MTDRSKHWGPAPHRPGQAARWYSPGKAVGTDSLGAAVGELRSQHPWDSQGEDVRNARYNARHEHVSKVYSSNKG